MSTPDRVDLEIIDYSTPRRTGPFHLFFSVPGEFEENGRKKFREIISGPNIKAIMEDIQPDLGVDHRLPCPTHIHGEEFEGDLLPAIMAAQDRWW